MQDNNILNSEELDDIEDEGTFITLIDDEGKETSFEVLDYEKTETLINKVIQDDEKQFDVTANKNGFTINTTQTNKNSDKTINLYSTKTS